MKRFLLPFLWLLFVIHWTTFSQNRLQDSIALVQFYEATDGPNWTNQTNWLSGPLDTWFGITMNSSNRVYRINLDSNNMSGLLTDSIGKLTGLKWLILSNNYLSGEIPKGIENLTSLQIFKIQNNSFSDTIPTQLTNLSSLQIFYADHNLLYSAIPDLSGMTNLEDFTIHNNLFTISDLASSGIFPGSIDIFQYAPQDTILNISRDLNSGTLTVIDSQYPESTYQWFKNSTLITEATRSIVPPGQGQYNSLVTATIYPGLILQSEILNFGYNAYTDSLALVALYKATDGKNWTNNTKWLADSVDYWFGITLDGTRRVTEIDLTGNHLKGKIPLEVANLSNLVSLKLGNNELNDDLPPLQRITSIDTIELIDNQLVFSNLSSSGIVPGAITRFEYALQDTVLQLEHNDYDFTMTVGDGGDTSNIYAWYIDGVFQNYFTRTITTEKEGLFNCIVFNNIYTGLTFMTDTLGFTYSIMSDSIALVRLFNETEGANWTNKTNWLSGNLSTWYGITINNGRVSSVRLSRNNLKGQIPEELGKLTQLTQLDLSNNKLDGFIPIELGDLTNLEMLKLNGNQLTSVIPAELGNLILITDLSLDFNHLSGNIPIQLGNLTDLKWLNLSNNNLQGSIPAQIENLTQLTWLALNNNQLSGNLPSEIGNLIHLSGIELNNNLFTGNIPSTWSNLTELVYLSLAHNTLTGGINYICSSMTHLSNLDLGFNHLYGWLPSMKNLTSLTYLDLQHNQFDGNLPYDIGVMSALNVLRVNNNMIYGPVPVGIETLTSLNTLALDSNHLSGDLPILTNSPNLTEISLFNNQFDFSNLTTSGLSAEERSGFQYAPQDTIIPIYYSWYIGSLKVLHDHTAGNTFTWYKNSIKQSEAVDTIALHGEGKYNCVINNPLFPDLTLYSDTFDFTYSLQTDSIALIKLFVATNGYYWTNRTNWMTSVLGNWFGITIDGDNRVSKVILNNNNLTGEIPVQIGDLTHLTHLQLFNNQLNNIIPEEIGSLTLLQNLYLNNNHLSGTVPAVLGDLSQLNTLYLNSNQFTGSIPVEIGNLVNLDYLSLNNNQLSGTIPVEIGDLTGVQTINLSNNQLSGNIPDEIGDLSGLISLYLSNNQLTGPIPTSIGSISNLRILNLSGNELSGQIPLEIGNLNNIRTLNLSNNLLSGVIPDAMEYLNNLQTMNISNNAFHFIDLEPIYDWNNYAGFGSSFSYIPQAQVGLAKTISVPFGAQVNVVLENYLTGEFDQYQWYKDDVLLTGKTDSLLIVPAFSTGDAGSYVCKITNSLANKLTLTSRAVILEETQADISLSNITAGNLTDTCYGATQNITVAGDGNNVIFETGSSVSLIAGQSIRFLPGFHAQSGSYVDAHITTDGSFCEQVLASSSMLSNSGELKSLETLVTYKPFEETIDEKLVKVYPNPNNGRFTVELTNFDEISEICIYNTLGAKVYHSAGIEYSSYAIDLPKISQGIYIVKVSNGKEQFTKRIVVKK